MPFHWGCKACAFCQASNKGKRARQTDGRSPRSHQRAENRLLRGVPHAIQQYNTERCPLCPNVAMRVHLAVDDTRSSQLTRATRKGKRESLCPIRNVRKPQTQSRVPPSSSLIGQPGTAKKEVSGTKKGPATNPSEHFPLENWRQGSLTFQKVSIKGRRARQRVDTRQVRRHLAEAKSTEELQKHLLRCSSEQRES